jgi:SAM-dependent methyltransferase
MPDTTRVRRPVSPSDRSSPDAEFDSFYEDKIRDLSRQHWTPVQIASRAARLLTQAGATRVLDVGSGVGKFCIVGALATTADFVGVERRGYLVDIARSAAIHHRARRATFVHANIDAFSFDGFSGIYLYNPFHEQISDSLVQIDDAVERSRLAYRHFVGRTIENLAALAAPVAVVTFNGFGGNMPKEYAFIRDEPAGTDRLELWIKD